MIEKCPNCKADKNLYMRCECGFQRRMDKVVTGKTRLMEAGEVSLFGEEIISPGQTPEFGCDYFMEEL